MEELPTLDMDLTINNKNRVWDIENSESAVNYLEIGQGGGSTVLWSNIGYCGCRSNHENLQE